MKMKYILKTIIIGKMQKRIGVNIMFLIQKQKKENDSSPFDWIEAGSYSWGITSSLYPIYVRKSEFKRRKSQIQEKRKRYFCEKTAHLNVSERYYSKTGDCSSYDSSSRY